LYLMTQLPERGDATTPPAPGQERVRWWKNSQITLVASIP